MTGAVLVLAALVEVDASAIVCMKTMVWVYEVRNDAPTGNFGGTDLDQSACHRLQVTTIVIYVETTYHISLSRNNEIRDTQITTRGTTLYNFSLCLLTARPQCRPHVCFAQQQFRTRFSPSLMVHRLLQEQHDCLEIH